MCLCRRIGDLSKEDSSLDFLENLTSLSMLYDALYPLYLFYLLAVYILLQNVSGFLELFLGLWEVVKYLEKFLNKLASFPSCNTCKYPWHPWSVVPPDDLKQLHLFLVQVPSMNMRYIYHFFMQKWVLCGRDLRFNKLIGSIPDSFQDFTVLQFL